ncbi:complement C1q tumor necrosis factor-related protein 3-like, partial [Saccostrea cucullata]|uniref:complement C1q tumor necrosis factor-related protein 3-like n=1 Tax=Saccostrea cuccullata TaxID=36930 RepID=UPI002ED0A93E
IIAFHARIEKFKQNLAFKAVVIFGKVTLNAGKAYDGSTGKFTAPVNGIYSFTWTIATTPGRRFSTAIVRDDEIIGYNHVNGKVGSNNSESGSATAIIKMAKSDKVWIRVQEHGEYAYALWSSFSGFLL